MQQETSPTTIRPPLALGCAGAAMGIFLLGVVAVFFVGFLESGADNGSQRLDPAASYAPGTVSYVPAHNLYVVREPGGTFIALSDIDAANRASATRCRVAQLAFSDPALPGLVKQYASRMSPETAGSTLLLREACHGAVYDAAGLRLDADGPNLDRFATAIDTQGRLTVDVTRRTCTERTAANAFASVACPK